VVARRFAASLILLAGCAAGEGKSPGDEADTDTDTDTDTDADLPGDTGADPTDPETADYPRPTALEVTCAATGNALRFECTITVEPAQPVALTFVRTDGLSVERAAASDAVETAHVLPVYFLAPAQEYTVEAHATAWPADVVATTLTTTAVPGFIGSHLDMTGTSTMGMIGSNLPCSDDAVAVVYDTNTGDLLWYQVIDDPGAFGGNDMAVFTEEHTVLGESQGDVVEVDLMGNDLMRLQNLDQAFGVTASGIFGNFHHDIAKHDGVYYVVYQQSYGGGGFGDDILDDMILFDATGTELARWYSEDHLDLPPDWSGDFTHTNTIFVDPNGDILLSFFGQSTIGKFEGDWTSPAFGTPLWLLRGSGAGEIGNTIATDWSAVAPASFSDQHNLHVRPDGLLELLDNTHGRALLIDLDEVGATATVLSQYETHENDCGPQGTAQSTAAGNPVVGCSGDFVREYDAVTGAMLWEAEAICPGGGGPGPSGATRWYPLDGW
jgi:hypothetical protein